MDRNLRNQPVNIEFDADVLKELPYFNAKIKVGELNKIKRQEAIFDKIVKQLPPNNDVYYIEHDRKTDSFKLKKDNKIKINENEVELLKQTTSHSHERLAREIKKRRSKCVANKKERKTVTGSVVMSTGALLAAGKIKGKYAKDRKNAIRKKLLKQYKELSKRIKKKKDPEKRKELELWMRDNIKRELLNLNG